MADELADEDSRQLLLVHHVRDGSVNLWGKPLERTRTGVWKAAPFIYILIFGDTISVLGIAGNLATYTSGTLHLSIAESANMVTNFMGFTYLLPLIGGFLADSYFSRFWIIAVSSLSSLAGLVVLALSTSLPSLQPPDCILSEDQAICPKAGPYVLSWFYAALGLISVGSAGMKPCMLSMGQDQFDETDREEKKQGSKFFTGYYIVLNLYSIFCVTVLFYVQSSVSFRWGYGSIAVMYFLAVSTFFLGTPFFRHIKPSGSSLTSAAQVVIAAIKNAKKPLPADAHDLHEFINIKELSTKGPRRMGHTQKLRCLDKAAIIKVEPASKWEMCTVTQVEELKAVIQIIPIWLCIMLVFTLYAQLMGLGVHQAATLDRRLGSHFTIPAGSIAIFIMVSALGFIVVYGHLLGPLLRKITGHPEGLSPLRKIGASLVLAILAMVVGAQVENKRVKAIQEHPQESIIPMSVFWLLPQLALLGCVEVLLGVAQLHLLYREIPWSMRSLAISLTFTTISIGYFVSSGLVNMVNKCSASTGGWLVDEFNKGGLRKYYYLLSMIMSIDLIIFMTLAHSYNYRNIQGQELENSMDDGGASVDA